MVKVDNCNEFSQVRALSTGSEKAFQNIFNRYYTPIYTYTKNIIKSDEFAEGIVQEVFIKVWENRQSLNPELSFKSYIYTIARNLSFNFLQKAATNKKLREEIFYLSKKAHDTTNDMVFEKELLEIKTKVISQLPPKRRLIFEMSRNQGKSYKDISQELNISISTVKNQMSKALGTLKHLVQLHGGISLIVTICMMNLAVIVIH
ncbi:RNA polymerase sigma-70 factor [Aquimarina agarivorans]|uniref:RNA polymerase sigma-70 factor n=1 Tax=Aquimarina agarivorans TaxID=980584 RepID=UPI000248FC77|nr:RNA polymerase sigma-70 factor [Aquimarina agarivorans]